MKNFVEEVGTVKETRYLTAVSQSKKGALVLHYVQAKRLVMVKTICTAQDLSREKVAKLRVIV